MVPKQLLERSLTTSYLVLPFRDHVNAHPWRNRRSRCYYCYTTRYAKRFRKSVDKHRIGLLPLLHAHVCTAVAVLALTFQLVPFFWYTCICYSVFRVWYQLQLKEDENAVRKLLLRHLFVYVAVCCLLPFFMVIILYRTAALGPFSTGDSNRYIFYFFVLYAC